MLKISAVIITLNEEKNIERCIKSLKRVADEIVVIDSYSTDKTEEISKKLGARFLQHPFNGYRDQKNFASLQATYDYVLSLDADEALSVELEESILRVKKNWQHDAYKFSRLNYYCGQWIYHTDWYPERKIRLFDRRKGAWTGDNIHETIKMNEGFKTGSINGDLLHWRYINYEEQLEEINRFSTFSANEYFKKGVKVNFIKVVAHPIWRFFHSFIIKRGFLDGYNGFIISTLAALLCMIKYVKLRNLHLIHSSQNLKLIKQHPSLATTGIRIGLDAKRAFFNHSGLGNYSRNLINALVKIENQSKLLLFTPKIKGRIILEDEKTINIIAPRRFYYQAFNSLWRSRFMLNEIKKYKIDIYHGLSHELPFGIENTDIKSVVTIHDLIFLRFPQFFSPIDVFIYRMKMEYACRVADKIVAISSQTRDDLIQFLNVDPKKIVIIHQGCNTIFKNRATKEQFQTVKEKYGVSDKYMLYVGTIEERKNFLTILKAIKEKNIDIPLVAIGRKTDYFHKIIKPYIEENKMENIIFPEKVTNDELQVLYQNSLCFIYPSLFEGFGIPILEAISSGTPVITSKGSCFEETGGPGSIYIEPLNPTEIGDAILQISVNNELRNQIIEKGLEHAKLFSPDLIAQSYMNLYKSMIETKPFK